MWTRSKYNKDEEGQVLVTTLISFLWVRIMEESEIQRSNKIWLRIEEIKIKK